MRFVRILPTDMAEMVDWRFMHLFDVGEQLQLRLETQRNPVADEVAAITAVVRPILAGTLFTLRNDLVERVGGLAAITLDLLSRLYRQGDGDCGICFEYAVHDAVQRREPSVLERIHEALTVHCRLPGDDLASILFAVEKTGTERLVDTNRGLLTDDSVLMYGTRGRPVKLSKHLTGLGAAFRRPGARPNLPQSISGLWKADLFLGTSDEDRWVGTSVKINPRHLEAGRGLRVGIVPNRQGRADIIRREGNLVVCPLPHDASFMEVFYQGWGVIQHLIRADFRMPREVDLPRPPERQVARYLVDRRRFPVLDVIDALEPLAQPELLETVERNADLVVAREGEQETRSVVAPVPRLDMG